MYTASECLEAVRLREKLTPIPYTGVNHILNMAIIDKVNNGWLCINAARYSLMSSDVRMYYIALGFHVDKDGIIYWLYDS